MEYQTRESILALADVDPEFKELQMENPYVEQLNVNSNIDAIRAELAIEQAALKASQAQDGKEAIYVEEDRQIPMRDGATIAIRIHKPKYPPADGSPVFVVYHGGGFVFGGLEKEAILCRQFVELGGVAVNVDYRLAPEHPFPIPVYDGFDALKWTASNYKDLKVNPSKGFIIGGISAGGNMAAVISHLYKDEGLSPLLTGVYLSAPSCCQAEALPEKYKKFYFSSKQNKDAPLLNDTNIALFLKLYQPHSYSPLRSPLLFPCHKGQSKTYFQICGMDPLRDEALIYEKVLREENDVVTKVHMYAGLPHTFWSLYPEARFTKKMREDSIEGLNWLLS